MTERQLRRIINEEINNILNEDIMMPERFVGITASNPKNLVGKGLAGCESRGFGPNPQEIVSKLEFESGNRITSPAPVIAMIVRFKDWQTNKEIPSSELSAWSLFHPNNVRSASINAEELADLNGYFDKSLVYDKNFIGTKIPDNAAIDFIGLYNAVWYSGVYNLKSMSLAGSDRRNPTDEDNFLVFTDLIGSYTPEYPVQTEMF